MLRHILIIFTIVRLPKISIRTRSDAFVDMIISERRTPVNSGILKSMRTRAGTLLQLFSTPEWVKSSSPGRKLIYRHQKKALKLIWTETCPGFIIANQSKMKKTNVQTKQPHDGKGFLALAGEAFQVLGEEIVQGKDKVVKVTSEKFETVKKAIRKVTHKKPGKKTAIPKKAALKPVHTTGKLVRKVAKKTAPARKKAAAKKTLSVK